MSRKPAKRDAARGGASLIKFSCPWSTVEVEVDDDKGETHERH